jgi:hypothetical protein
MKRGGQAPGTVDCVLQDTSAQQYWFVSTYTGHTILHSRWQLSAHARNRLTVHINFGRHVPTSSPAVGVDVDFAVPATTAGVWAARQR